MPALLGFPIAGLLMFAHTYRYGMQGTLMIYTIQITHVLLRRGGIIFQMPTPIFFNGSHHLKRKPCECCAGRFPT